MITRKSTTRPGFTLVELLVAAALCILIMTVIAYAFSAGLDSFRQVKAIGDLQERLRTAEVILRDDLRANHFDTAARVSDQRMDLVAPSATPSGPTAWKPPRGGFFRIVQESPLDTTVTNTSPFQFEGYDQDGIVSTRATDHILHMSVKRSQDKPERMFRALVPASAYSGTPGLASFGLAGLRNGDELVSPWAEVAYFLDTQNQTGTTPGNLKTYPLVRRVRVLAMGTSGVSWQTNRTSHQDVSYSPDTATTPANAVNGPDEIANPKNRLGGISSTRNPAGSLDALRKQSDSATMGNDILLTNVISFEVRGTWDGVTTTAFSANTHTDTPFQDVPASTNNSTLSGTRVFDTWWQQPDDTTTTGVNESDNWRKTGDPNCVPSFIRLKAVQIKVRVWDSKTQTTRQITIIQDV